MNAKLPKYYKSDFKKVSWQEYGQVLDSLLPRLNRYLKKNKIRIDAIVPIMRAGGIAAQYFAYKLHLLKILPVQYKYLYEEGGIKLRKINNYSSLKPKTLPNPTFLVVENNHCFGTTSKMAIKDIKKLIPRCKIIYVAIFADYSFQEMKDAEAVFYGRLTNETKDLTEKEAKILRIKNGLSLFPWESLEEEWAAVNSKKFDYR